MSDEPDDEAGTPQGRAQAARLAEALQRRLFEEDRKARRSGFAAWVAPVLRETAGAAGWALRRAGAIPVASRSRREDERAAAAGRLRRLLAERLPALLGVRAEALPDLKRADAEALRWATIAFALAAERHRADIEAHGAPLPFAASLDVRAALHLTARRAGPGNPGPHPPALQVEMALHTLAFGRREGLTTVQVADALGGYLGLGRSAALALVAKAEAVIDAGPDAVHAARTAALGLGDELLIAQYVQSLLDHDPVQE